ncbi:hypothetical protein BOX15_Mlig032859g2 [Macrostomum lignano]|uniref:Sulfotransfer_1 domain-containing protein n=1 Tax=Macrostomum lignano TaxID=282301 RepID=A0A267F0Z1_9PLAT|nr:hypothetical protein BOX15_Mlig032859g2 [Macrostomum lignano]
MTSTRRQFEDTDRSNLQVISVGLMRTGTNSQMKAFEILLGGRCYHMDYILHENRSHLKLWYQASTNGLTRELADKIFCGFQATADFPACLFYKDLARIYPDARFVLSVRDPKRWATSMRGTVLRLAKVIQMVLTPLLHLIGLYYIVKLKEVLFDQRLRLDLDATDEELIRIFDRHVEDVIRSIPKERLLVFRVAEGWEPLCQFLGVPVPGVPFPRVNDAAEFQQRTRTIFVSSVALNTAFCAAAGSVLWFGAKFCLRRWG